MKPSIATLAILTLLALPAAAQDAPRAADPAETLLRRAAYQETQKQASEKAIEIYRVVADRYPDSPASLKALERIAALETELGDAAGAKEAEVRLAALRAKLRAAKETDKEPAKDDGEKRAAEVRKRVQELRAKGVPPEEIRATIRREAAEQTRARAQREKRPPAKEGEKEPAKGDRPKTGPAGTAPPIPTDLPKELRARVDRIIEDGKKKGQTREEIRARVWKLLDEVKAKPKKGRLV